MTLDLKTALAERRKAAETALRMPFCLDRDLVDEFDELQQQRARIAAPFELRRQRMASDLRMGDDPEKIGAGITVDERAATAEIDAKLDELQARGAASTVELVFAVVPPEKYQEIVNAHLVDGQLDPVAFSRHLVEVTFRGVEQDGVRVDGASWEEISAAMSFGEVDAVASAVVAANRGTVAAPFSRRSSASSR